MKEDIENAAPSLPRYFRPSTCSLWCSIQYSIPKQYNTSLFDSWTLLLAAISTGTFGLNGTFGFKWDGLVIQAR